MRGFLMFSDYAKGLGMGYQNHQKVVLNSFDQNLRYLYVRTCTTHGSCPSVPITILIILDVSFPAAGNGHETGQR